MNAVRWLVVAVAVDPAGAAGGDEKKGQNKLPADVVAVLEKAAELEVYSLDGMAEKGAKDAWRGARVLGKAGVKKEDDRKVVAAAVKKAVEEGGEPARCFIPRHGIRATHDGKTVDLVICFECGWVHVYTGDGTERTTLTISGSAHKPLHGVLAAAKVPLAKPGK